MGWSGYGLYEGDETQTSHLRFMKWAGWKDEDALDDAISIGYDKMLKFTNGEIKKIIYKTKLTNDMKLMLSKNINKVLRKMPKLTKFGFKNEYDAIDWQMLLALFVDNKLLPPKLIIDNGILATEYLLGSHSDSFDEPHKRKAALRRFIKKVNKLYNGVINLI